METSGKQFLERLAPALAEIRKRDQRVGAVARRRVMERLGRPVPVRPRQAPASAPAAAWAAAAVVMLVLAGAAWLAAGSGIAPRGADSARALAEATVYVDFSKPGRPESGSAEAPYGTLGRGVEIASPGGTLRIQSGTTGETLRIEKPLRMVAVAGEVRIGAPRRN